MPHKDDDMPYDDDAGDNPDAGGEDLEDFGGEEAFVEDTEVEAAPEGEEEAGEVYESPAAALEAAIAEHGTGDAQALIDWMSENGFEVSSPGMEGMEEGGLEIEIGTIPPGPLGGMRDQAAANQFSKTEGPF